MNSKAMIPMVDTLAWHQPIQQELRAAASRVLDSGRFLMGEEVTAFEQEVGAFLQANQAVSCGNGTDALILALSAAGLGPGDEVITTPFTFFATAEAIVRVGATPVFADIEPETFNMDPLRIQQAMTDRTRAVLVVHLFGLPARIQEIQWLCEEHSLLLIEDCAQSFGASVNGRMTGTWGDLGCFSFFPSKNLGGFGDGGLITAKTEFMAEQLKVLRNHGSSIQYRHECMGFNSRLDEMQAALLRVKLKYIERYNQERKKIAEVYRSCLQGLDVLLPAGQGHVYHQFTVLTDQRDQLKAHLASQGIASALYYPIPLHQQPVFRGLPITQDLFVAEQVSRRCLSLPVFPGMTAAQVSRVAESVSRFFLDEQAEPSYGLAGVLYK
ncbi:DegT/DnrJ/EryC1/StrS family aminotransferase [Endozoicomonas sp. 4G]|uniref:DegT/DnrJ/EryC1/StrS family aminotransferase n=1 Tax=Endozoicomonas sp. 4G TaxID=2872754 RepID=UPI002078E975|nr:DegT/DnrJ/EryC1/StrS family aminotransferase [Endozoicomonas sp. 4G]